MTSGVSRFSFRRIFAQAAEISGIRDSRRRALLAGAEPGQLTGTFEMAIVLKLALKEITDAKAGMAGAGSR
jgi:hypothetical protein